MLSLAASGCSHTPAPPPAAAPTPAPEPQDTSGAARPLITFPNGLQMQDIVVGTGEVASTYRTVTVHYTLWVQGQKIESTHDGGQPFSFILGEGKVIKGWEQGIKGMRAGGTRKLVVPPSLGYGPEQQGPIPANSTLTFEVELLDVQ